MADRGSVWAQRFILAAIIQGAIAFVITAILLYLALPWSNMASPAAVVAFGSAGTWLTVGYLGYIMFPVIGTGLSALFYHYIESVMDRPYTGSMTWLAWGHLLLGNIGIGLALLLMMYGGYVGGSMMVPAYLGGQGQGAQVVHEQVLGALTFPISTLFLIGSIGPLLGGIGFGMQIWRKR